MEFSTCSTCSRSSGGASAQLFMNLVNTLLASQCALKTDNDYPPSYSPFLKNGDAFDYIIVGAGSAGSLLANRLSENERVKVLLIEAGKNPSLTSQVPALSRSLRATEEDWSYRTEPSSTSCKGLKDQRCIWPRGKVLGGSSGINGMVYIRGNDRDYAEWAVHNPGWDYNSLKPYFQKHERAYDIKMTRSVSDYGVNGELYLGRHRSPHPIRQVMIEAAKYTGNQYFQDPNQIGFFDLYAAIENGTRASTARAFLSKIKERRNLFIAQNAQVGRVTFEGNTNNVNGVEVRIGNNIITLKAKREVIISGGSINSPQILMNSGIGPKSHLESLNIPVKEDLPVGENLLDHMLMSYLMKIDERLYYHYDLIDESYKYYKNRTGLYATTDINDFVVTANTKNNSNYPDIHAQFTVHRKGDVAGIRSYGVAVGLEEATIQYEEKLIKESALFRANFMKCKPKSMGKILLASNNPYEYPKIHPNYVNDPNGEDMETMKSAFYFFNELFDSAPFRNYNGASTRAHIKNNNVEFVRQFIPACNNINDDDQWYECAIRNIGSTFYHPTSSNKMGPRSERGVVDSNLRVHGVKNLRVIDASIFPTMPSHNTNAPTIMVAEKGAALIKETWNGINFTC